MSGPPAKIVCQVSGAARLPTGWLMKGFCGGVGVECGAAGEEGWSGPHSAASFASFHQAQLLIHSSSATTTNRGHIRASRQHGAGRAGPLAGIAGAPWKKPRRSISTLSLQKQSCLYWAQTEERLTAFFSLPPPFSIHLYLLPPPLSPQLFLLPALPPVFHLPAFTCSSGTNPQLSRLTPSKCTGNRTSHCFLTATICLSANSKGRLELSQQS